MQFSCFQNDCFVKRKMLVTIILVSPNMENIFESEDSVSVAILSERLERLNLTFFKMKLKEKIVTILLRSSQLRAQADALNNLI
jgi:hypothetical protein